MLARPSRFAAQRLLVLFSCFWLLGSWSCLLYRYGAVASVRLLMINIMVGLMLLWPAWRLSIPFRFHDRRQGIKTVLSDWLCLQLLLQVAIWPLRLTADWSLTQTVGVVFSLAIWPLATAGVVAWAWQRQYRCMGMLACSLLVFAWPIAQAAGILPLSLAQWSPLALLWNLSAPVIGLP